MGTSAEQTGQLAEALTVHADLVAECRGQVVRARTNHRRTEDWTAQTAREDPQLARALAEGLESGKFTIGGVQTEVEVRVWADIMDGEECVAHVQGDLSTEGTTLEAFDLDELRDESGELPFDSIMHAGPAWDAEDED